MSVVIDGSSGITTNSGTVVSTTDATLNGLTVGKGGGAVSTNTAVGASALTTNSTGAYNTVIGYNAGYDSSTAQYNTYVGANCATQTNTGSNNSALGYQALRSNTTGSYNTATGYQAGYSNAQGSANTFLGYQAGYSFVAGSAASTYNTFLGYSAGYSVTTGTKNTIIGTYSGNQGGLDIRTSSNYIVLSDGDGNPRFMVNNSGYMYATSDSAFNAGTTYSGHAMDSGGTGASLRVYCSNASYTGNVLVLVGVRTTTNGTYNLINALNNNGTGQFIVKDSGNVVNVNNSYGAISDVKLKENIADASPKLDALMQVKVRNYNLKIDPTHKQLGVIAQELETIFPSMVEETIDRDTENNDLGTTTKQVKYSVFVPMLIKGLQELKTIVDAQVAEIAELKTKVNV
jgi:hypothetical protein